MRVRSWLAIYALAQCLLIAPSVAGEFEDGLSAWKGGDYAAALRLWRPLADQDHAAAEYNLALMYANGQGVPQDDAEAIKWYRRAAGHGYAPAQLAIGVSYDEGRGLPQSHSKAMKWYRIAAQQGDVTAQAHAWTHLLYGPWRARERLAGSRVVFACCRAGQYHGAKQSRAPLCARPWGHAGQCTGLSVVQPCGSRRRYVCCEQPRRSLQADDGEAGRSGSEARGAVESCQGAREVRQMPDLELGRLRVILDTAGNVLTSQNAIGVQLKAYCTVAIVDPAPCPAHEFPPPITSLCAPEGASLRRVSNCLHTTRGGLAISPSGP